MILTTHILGAAVLTRPFWNAHPVLLFAGAILSHYLLDAIPHRDYELTSIVKDGEGHNARVIGIDRKKILHDFTRIFVDGIVGAIVLFFMAGPELTLTSLMPFAAIIIGSVLPDALQPVFWLWQKFAVYGYYIFFFGLAAKLGYFSVNCNFAFSYKLFGFAP